MAPPDPSLPQRRSGGYQITAIVLEVTASKAIVARITRTVTLPSAPSSNLNEIELATLLRGLTTPALAALRILEANEGIRAKGGYTQPQYERVQIKVLSGGRLVGRVNGAQQTFDLRGKMTSAGLLTHPDTSRRVNPPGGKDDRNGNGRPGRNGRN